MNSNPNWFFEDPVFRRIWDSVEPYTMTSPARGFALYQAVRYLCDRRLAGNIVESGVWRGGSSMIIALTLIECGDESRELWMFDTYGGMPEPEPIDVDLHGRSASELMEADAAHRETSDVWAIADLETVRENMESTGYPMDRVHLIEGDVRTTAAVTRTGTLALLRLDTDWHSSTAAELRHFWPRLNQHGVLLIDDYGHWQGSRVAVDDFFFGDDAEAKPILLQPVDYTGRSAIRSEPNLAIPWETRYDHRPVEFDTPDLLPLFPTLVDTDPRTCPDPRLRRTVPHIWRTDSREASRATGVISLEEAYVLHAVAQTRSGRRGIEIGSHYAWSTAHLLAAGLDLDAVDPAFGDRQHLEHVRGNLSKWVEDGQIRLHPGFSPEILAPIAASRPELFGFAFVDGLHSEGGPTRDVDGLIPHLADDAIVVFHDLTFPDVAAAVRHIASLGWQIRVYNTMQVMAAAWRDGEPPPQYGGDRSHGIPLPVDLQDLAPKL
ncbi:MAG: class I SAM-dependent methyltransferase [Acidimicrobiales bacterium]